MKAKRVVIDTNVFISAFLISGGKPDRVLRYLLEKDIDFLFSRETMDELITRLARPKFRKYRNDKETTAFIENLSDLAIWISPLEKLNICRDPDDNKFLEIALAGEADCIISGDQDLLILNPFERVAILSPAGFLDKIEK